MTHWSSNTVFYHIYPLGLCGALECNDFHSAPVHRLDNLIPWQEHAAGLGCNGLYIGPLFESTVHGYDTADYYNVDRRLGDRHTLTRFVERAHQLGIKVILDGVFNHVGRDFWAFRDVQANRDNSAYCSWFSGLRFDRSNNHNDSFAYDTWQGHENLVKLNLNHADVRNHLFGAVQQWIDDYDIDGLRLDTADILDKGFLSDLAGFSKSLKPDFWLMGEVIHGDYRQWANPERIDSVTNYECYKGLYSSFNDHNFFEIAWSLNRQFGSNGMYKELPLYSFADNHDVDRVASVLKEPACLTALYAMLMTMPGVPSIYYGSEFGVQGKRDGSDRQLRPQLDLDSMQHNNPVPELIQVIRVLSTTRKTLLPLREGTYHQLHLTNEQFAFSRTCENHAVISMFNVADHTAKVEVHLNGGVHPHFKDALRENDIYTSEGGRLSIELPAKSFRVLIPSN